MRLIPKILPLVAVIFTALANPTARADTATRIESAASALLATETGIVVEPLAGSPPMGKVLKDGTVIAWYGGSYDIMGSVGYSGRPIDVLVIVNTDATIRVAKLVTQDEPILTIGVPPDALDTYVAAYTGVDVLQPVSKLVQDGSVPDRVSGATISSGVIRNAILRTGRLLAERAKLSPQNTGGEKKPLADWDTLLADGTVGLMSISFAQAHAAMPGVDTIPDKEGIFAELAVAVLSDRAAANALIGAKRFDRLATEFAADDTLLLIAARGSYSIRGTDWIKSGLFNRLEITIPGHAPFNPTKAETKKIDAVYAQGAPDFREAMLLGIPASAGLTSDQPFSVTLIADKTAEGAAAPAHFTLTMNEDASHPLILPDEDEPLWLQNWRDATVELVVLFVILAVLFLALYVSNPIVRRPKVYFWFRVGFLLFTLIGLGWYAGAQLSIVQVAAFMQSVIGGFDWDVFLLAPLVFILWAFVAIGILFWGRGVYCGWLCPFGALQELTYKAAQRLGLKSLTIPWEIHERLWPLKYIALLVILGVSMQDLKLAFSLSEIEPFKTAIILHFLRDWPYVLYALAILAASLFVERFFCRYLCPLGAALAIPSKFKIFDWLIRRPQCGRECRVCAVTCTVQAIDPIGRINPNECIYCLKCQVNFHDAEVCVPLKMRAQRRSGSTAKASVASES